MMSFGNQTLLLLLFAAAWLGSPSSDVRAEDTNVEAERLVQGYLAMWSRDKGINAASIARFYAPRVIYYGKPMSRAQVLTDKQAYIRQWPVRSYTEVPGSLAGTCTADRSRCRVGFDMKWRRMSRDAHVAAGRAHVTFEFVPAEDGRKIAKESARFF